MEALKRELRLKRFGFGDTSPDDFYRFQWNWPRQPHTFVVYRIVMAVYQLTWNVLVIAFWDDTRFYRPVDTVAKWPIYLSNWTFLLLTVYFLTAAVSVVVYHINTRRSKVAYAKTNPSNIELVDRDSPPLTPAAVEDHSSLTTQQLPWYFKVTWFLQTITTSASLFVAMGYWFFEYDPKYEKLHAFTVHVHAVGTLMALFDFAASAVAWRLLHFIYPTAFFTTYIIFSLVYYYCGGINPYGGREMYEGLIDWEDGVGHSVAMSMVFVFVLGPVLHSFYFGLYLLRRVVAGDKSASFFAQCSCTVSGQQTSYHVRDVRGDNDHRGAGKRDEDEFQKLSEGSDQSIN